jgi:hypothetical protein
MYKEDRRQALILAVMAMRSGRNAGGFPAQIHRSSAVGPGVSLLLHLEALGRYILAEARGHLER